MTRATFAEALRSAVPELKISAEPSRGPAPEGHMPIEFHVRPTSHGVRLSIKIGDDRPHRFTFLSEEEAAEFVGRVYADAKS